MEEPVPQTSDNKVTTPRKAPIVSFASTSDAPLDTTPPPAVRVATSNSSPASGEEEKSATTQKDTKAAPPPADDLEAMLQDHLKEVATLRELQKKESNLNSVSSLESTPAKGGTGDGASTDSTPAGKGGGGSQLGKQHWEKVKGSTASIVRDENTKRARQQIYLRPESTVSIVDSEALEKQIREMEASRASTSFNASFGAPVVVSHTTTPSGKVSSIYDASAAMGYSIQQPGGGGGSSASRGASFSVNNPRGGGSNFFGSGSGTEPNVPMKNVTMCPSHDDPFFQWKPVLNMNWNSQVEYDASRPIVNLDDDDEAHKEESSSEESDEDDHDLYEHETAEEYDKRKEILKTSRLKAKLKKQQQEKEKKYRFLPEHAFPFEEARRRELEQEGNPGFGAGANTTLMKSKTIVGVGRGGVALKRNAQLRRKSLASKAPSSNGSSDQLDSASATSPSPSRRGSATSLAGGGIAPSPSPKRQPSFKKKVVPQRRSLFDPEPEDGITQQIPNDPLKLNIYNELHLPSIQSLTGWWSELYHNTAGGVVGKEGKEMLDELHNIHEDIAMEVLFPPEGFYLTGPVSLTHGGFKGVASSSDLSGSGAALSPDDEGDASFGPAQKTKSKKDKAKKGGAAATGTEDNTSNPGSPTSASASGSPTSAAILQRQHAAKYHLNNEFQTTINLHAVIDHREEKLSSLIQNFCTTAVPTAMYLIHNMKLLTSSLVHVDAITYHFCGMDDITLDLFPKNPMLRSKLGNREYQARKFLLEEGVPQLAIPFTIMVELLGVKVLAYPRLPFEYPEAKFNVEALLEYHRDNVANGNNSSVSNAGNLNASSSAGATKSNKLTAGHPHRHHQHHGSSSGAPASSLIASTVLRSQTTSDMNKTVTGFLSGNSADLVYGAVLPHRFFFTPIAFGQDKEVTWVMQKAARKTRIKGQWLGRNKLGLRFFNCPSNAQVFRSRLDNRIYPMHIHRWTPSTVQGKQKKKRYKKNEHGEDTTDEDASSMSSSSSSSASSSSSGDNNEEKKGGGDGGENADGGGSGSNPLRESRKLARQLRQKKIPVIPNKYFIEVFRPEFIRQHTKLDVGPDAGTPVSVVNRIYDNKEREDLVKHLIAYVIPEAVKQLVRDTNYNGVNLDTHLLMERGGSGVSKFLHQHGINMRFLPLVREHLVRLPFSGTALIAVEIEMVCRALKRWILDASRTHYCFGFALDKGLMESLIKACLVPFTEQFWNETVEPNLHKKYPQLAVSHHTPAIIREAISFNRFVPRFLAFMGVRCFYQGAPVSKPDEFEGFLTKNPTKFTFAHVPKVHCPGLPAAPYREGEELTHVKTAKQYLRNAIAEMSLGILVNRHTISQYILFLKDRGEGRCPEVEKVLAMESKVAKREVGKAAQKKVAESVGGSNLRYRLKAGRGMRVFDTSTEATNVFRFHHGQRVQMTLGAKRGLLTTIIGILDGALYRHDDDEDGAEEVLGSSYNEIIANYGFVLLDAMSIVRKKFGTGMGRIGIVDAFHYLGERSLLILERNTAYLMAMFGFSHGDRLQFRRGPRIGQITTILGASEGHLWHHVDGYKFPECWRNQDGDALREQYQFAIFGRNPSSHVVENFPAETRGVFSDKSEVFASYKMCLAYNVFYRQVLQLTKGKFKGRRCIALGTVHGHFTGMVEGEPPIPQMLGDTPEMIVQVHGPLLQGICSFVPEPPPPPPSLFYPMSNGEFAVFDVSCAHCLRFGAVRGQRIKLLRGAGCGNCGVVIGIRRHRLWVHFQDDPIGCSPVARGSFAILQGSVFEPEPFCAQAAPHYCLKPIPAADYTLPFLTQFGEVVQVDIRPSMADKFGYYHGQLLEIFPFNVDGSSDYRISVVVIGVCCDELWFQLQYESFIRPFDGTSRWQLDCRYKSKVIGIRAPNPWRDMFWSKAHDFFPTVYDQNIRDRSVVVRRTDENELVGINVRNDVIQRVLNSGGAISRREGDGAIPWTNGLQVLRQDQIHTVNINGTMKHIPVGPQATVIGVDPHKKTVYVEMYEARHPEGGNRKIGGGPSSGKQMRTSTNDVSSTNPSSKDSTTTTGGDKIDSVPVVKLTLHDVKTWVPCQDEWLREAPSHNGIPVLAESGDYPSRIQMDQVDSPVVTYLWGYRRPIVAAVEDNENGDPLDGGEAPSTTATGQLHEKEDRSSEDPAAVADGASQGTNTPANMSFAVGDGSFAGGGTQNLANNTSKIAPVQKSNTTRAEEFLATVEQFKKKANSRHQYGDNGTGNAPGKPRTELVILPPTTNIALRQLHQEKTGTRYYDTHGGAFDIETMVYQQSYDKSFPLVREPVFTVARSCLYTHRIDLPRVNMELLRVLEFRAMEIYREEYKQEPRFSILIGNSGVEEGQRDDRVSTSTLSAGNKKDPRLAPLKHAVGYSGGSPTKSSLPSSSSTGSLNQPQQRSNPTSSSSSSMRPLVLTHEGLFFTQEEKYCLDKACEACSDLYWQSIEEELLKLEIDNGIEAKVSEFEKRLYLFPKVNRIAVLKWMMELAGVVPYPYLQDDEIPKGKTRSTMIRPFGKKTRTAIPRRIPQDVLLSKKKSSSSGAGSSSQKETEQDILISIFTKALIIAEKQLGKSLDVPSQHEFCVYLNSQVDLLFHTEGDEREAWAQVELNERLFLTKKRYEELAKEDFEKVVSTIDENSNSSEKKARSDPSGSPTTSGTTAAQSSALRTKQQSQFRFILSDASLVVFKPTPSTWRVQRGDVVIYKFGDISGMAATILGMHHGRLWRYEHHGLYKNKALPFEGTEASIFRTYGLQVTIESKANTNVLKSDPLEWLTWDGSTQTFDIDYESCQQYGVLCGERYLPTCKTRRRKLASEVAEQQGKGFGTSDDSSSSDDEGVNKKAKKNDMESSANEEELGGFPFKNKTLVVIGIAKGMLWFALDQTGAIPFPAKTKDPISEYRLRRITTGPLMAPPISKSCLFCFKGFPSDDEQGFVEGAALGLTPMFFNITPQVLKQLGATHLQRIQFQKGPAAGKRVVVIGVRHGRLWGISENEAGARPIPGKSLFDLDPKICVGDAWGNYSSLALPQPQAASFKKTELYFRYTATSGALCLFDISDRVSSTFGLAHGQRFSYVDTIGTGAKKICKTRHGTVLGMRDDILWYIPDEEPANGGAKQSSGDTRYQSSLKVGARKQSVSDSASEASVPSTSDATSTEATSNKPAGIQKTGSTSSSSEKKRLPPVSGRPATPFIGITDRSTLITKYQTVGLNEYVELESRTW